MRESSYYFLRVLVIAMLSVHPSICHMSGLVKNGAIWDLQLFTVSCNISLYYSQGGATQLSLCNPDKEFGRPICILT